MSNKPARFTVSLILILIVLVSLVYYVNRCASGGPPPPGGGTGGGTGPGGPGAAWFDRSATSSENMQMAPKMSMEQKVNSPELDEATQTYSKIMQGAGKPTSNVMSQLSVTEAAAAYGRKLTVENDLSLHVENVEKSKEEVRTVIAKKGYIEASEFNIDTDGNPTANITVRVLSEYYPEIRAAIIKLGTVINEEESIQDITDEYFDIQSYISTREMYLSRLKALLAEQKGLNNIISLTEMVTNIQGEINRSKEQLNQFAQQVKFSTIRLALYQPTKVKTLRSNIIQTQKLQTPKFSWNQNEAVDEGMFMFKARLNAIINWIIYQLTANLLYWLLAVVVLLVARHYLRKYKINILDLHKLHQKE